MINFMGQAESFASEYEFRINSGRHDKELQEHSYKQAMMYAALAQAAALERILDALEAIQRSGVVSESGNSAQKAMPW